MASDPYARYKAQLASYRRDYTPLNGVSKTAVTSAGVPPTTASSIQRRTSTSASNVGVRQSSSNVTPLPVTTQQSGQGVTMSRDAARQLISTMISSNVSSQQSSTSPPAVVSSNVAPRLSTQSLMSTDVSTQKPTSSLPSTTSPSTATRLSTPNTISSNIAQRLLPFSTPSVTSTGATTQRQSVPWRKGQQASPEDSNVAKPDSTSSMNRRSVVTCLFTCLLNCYCLRYVGFRLIVILMLSRYLHISYK